MANIQDKDKFAKMLDQLRPLTRFGDSLIRSRDNGTPSVIQPSNMDCLNSLQVAFAREHVICKQADFALAKRFMKEHPHHKGFQVTST